MATRGRPTIEDQEWVATTPAHERRIQPEHSDPCLGYPGVQARVKQFETQA